MHNPCNQHHKGNPKLSKDPKGFNWVHSFHNAFLQYDWAIHRNVFLFPIAFRRTVYSLWSPSLLFSMVVPSRDCLLTVSVFSDSKVVPRISERALYPQYCTIDHFYWVAKYTHDKGLLNADKYITKPFILRSNVESQGYLSSLLPLLFNSTYSLIVDDKDLVRPLPSSEWIDSAIAVIEQNLTLVPACGLYPNSQVARGCMLLKTSDLRSIWTRTTFRRRSTPMMELFSHILRCKFQYTLTSGLLPAPRLRASSYVPSDFVSSQCERVYDVVDFTCDAHYHQTGTIGVVLPQYKRLWLERQLNSVTSGTLKASQIIVVQDAQHQDYQPLLRAWPAVKHVWTTNWDSPFFLRFLVPLLMTAQYIHNIDDDIIFGKTTMQTLNNIVDQNKGVVGVNGRVVLESDYVRGNFKQSNPNRMGVGVPDGDFLCNTYAGGLESVKVFWRYRPYTENNGEDIHYSLSNTMECGSPVKVMSSNVATDKFENHGRDKVATYIKGDHFVIRGKIIRAWKLRGLPFMRLSHLESYPPDQSQFSSSYREEATYWLVSFTTLIVAFSQFHHFLCCCLTTNTPEYRWNRSQLLNHLQHILAPRIHQKGHEVHATLLPHRHQLLEARPLPPPPAVEQPHLVQAQPRQHSLLVTPRTSAHQFQPQRVHSQRVQRRLLDARHVPPQQLHVALRVQRLHVRAHRRRHGLLAVVPLHPAPLRHLRRAGPRQGVPVVDRHQSQGQRHHLRGGALRAVRRVGGAGVARVVVTRVGEEGVAVHGTGAGVREGVVIVRCTDGVIVGGGVNGVTTTVRAAIGVTTTVRATTEGTTHRGRGTRHQEVVGVAIHVQQADVQHGDALYVLAVRGEERMNIDGEHHGAVVLAAALVGNKQLQGANHARRGAGEGHIREGGENRLRNAGEVVSIEIIGSHFAKTATAGSHASVHGGSELGRSELLRVCIAVGLLGKGFEHRFYAFVPIVAEVNAPSGIRCECWIQPVFDSALDGVNGKEEVHERKRNNTGNFNRI